MTYSLKSLGKARDKVWSLLLPNIPDLKADMLQKLSDVQMRNTIQARAYYYLIYSHYFDKQAKRLIMYDDLISDVLLGPNEQILPPSGLTAQVLMKLVKQICETPKLLMRALVNAKVDSQVFAFLTFPAMFGFFTSLDLCDRGCRVAESIIMGKNVSEELVSMMCLSLLFSCYRFTANLWIVLSDSLNKESLVTKKVVMGRVSAAVSECAPLVLASVKRVLDKMLAHRAELLAKVVVVDFLPKTLEIWCSCGQEGVSFRYKDLVLECLRDMSTSKQGMLLSSLMLTGRGNIVTIPSFTSACEMSNDKLIVCAHDLLVLTDVLKSHASEIEMFDQLKIEADNFDCVFIPMIVNIFFPVTATAVSPNFFKSPVMNIPVDNDPIFMRAYMEKHELDDPAFRKFKCLKDIEIGKELYRDQEVVMTRRSELDKANTIHTILQDLKSMYLQQFVYRRLTENPKLKSMPVSNLTSMILEGTTDYPSLARPAYLAVIEAGFLPPLDIPPDLLRSLVFLLKGQIGQCWIDLGEMATCPFLLRLVPVLSNVTSLTYSRSFLFITQFLSSLRTVCDHFAPDPSDETFASLIRAIVVSSVSDGLLSRFFFYERIVLHSEFMRGLDESTATNWNVFFQAIWKSIAEDRDLFTRCPHS